MRLFIMRHGDAGFNAASDYERSLTDKGRERVLQVADYLKKHKVNPEKLLISPYTRTLQTASILQASLDIPASCMALSDAVVPEADPRKAVPMLPDMGLWVIVSHMPFVDRLMSFLTEGHCQGISPFYTAQITELDVCASIGGTATLINNFVPHL